MQNKGALIATLNTTIEQKDKQIEQLQSLLDEALEVNQGLQEPIIDSFHDL